MALSRFLLLCMIASEVWDADTRPTDFVCDRQSRRAMNTVAEMEAVLRNCDGQTTLTSPLQLPCIKVHKASWENKSHQEKRGDIVASLEVLVKSLKTATLNQPRCATSLLDQLKHNINNYLHILTHLDLSDPAEDSPSSCTAQSTTSMSTVLLTYNRLITGKLEWFVASLTDRCPRQ